MPSYSWWQAIRVLAGQEPGVADLPSLEPPCLESQPAAIVSLLADGAAVVLGVPFGGDVHEEIPAAAWRRIRIELRTSRTKARPFETVAALPGPVLGDVFASRGWTDLQVPERELARLAAAAERLARSTEGATAWPAREIDEGAGLGGEAVYRSGLPGQPSSIHLVEAELDRRVAAGQVWESKAQCGEELAAWLRQAHPSAARATPKTIVNRLRGKIPTARN